MKTETCNKKLSGQMFVRAVLLLTVFLAIQAHALEMPSAPGPSSFPEALIEAIRKSGAKGVISAFRGDARFHASELQLSYYTNTEGKLTGEFLIGNFTDVARSYTLAVLVDYKQKKFITGGRRVLYHRLNVPAWRHVILPLAIDDIADGGHDVVVLAMDNRQKKDTIGTNFPVLYHRSNFYVKRKDMPVVRYERYKEDGGVFHVPRVVVNSSGRVADFQEGRSETGVAGKKNYFVHINNETETTSKYVVLAIKPGAAAPIMQLEEGMPLFIEVGAAQSAMLPLAGKLVKAAEQIHVVLFREPFVRLEKKHGEINEVHSELLISKGFIVN